MQKSEGTNLQVAYYAERRLVVLDLAIQPSAPDHMLLYSVQGHSMCLRRKSEDYTRLSFKMPQETSEFALDQYREWRSQQPSASAKQFSAPQLAVTPFPFFNKTCPACDGQGTWMDRLNKCSYGVIQEESNIVERCATCNGAGSVEDIL